MLRFARGLCSCLCCRSRVLAVAAPSAPNNGRLGEGITHRTVFMNDINMHVSEKGDEPVVLLLHGFPELWYTWRHQMHRLAALRYRTVAPDLRGFGDTEAPADHRDYSLVCCSICVASLICCSGLPLCRPTLLLWSTALIFRTAALVCCSVDLSCRSAVLVFRSADLVFHSAGLPLCRPVSAHHVFVVGHDWGSMVAWNLSMFRPDKVRAMVNLSQAFTPRNPTRKSLEHLRSAFGDDYYICRGCSGDLTKICSGGLIRKCSGGLARKYSRSLTRKYSGGLTRKCSRGLTRKYSGSLTRKYFGGLTRKCSGGLTKKCSGGLTKKCSGGLTRKYSRILTRKYSGGLTRKYFRSLTRKYFRSLTRKYSGCLIRKCSGGLTRYLTRI
ncbi:hypothetical protein ZIOFF_045990 [Zingiber officinale]|uniref:AB hydrolase-1 domain-containing protein n=1 Tax=Zingiber officinale TaxID=94328 RepID=A0A8J5G1H5_ZINOF|nr:hypothetical protein ZIOFF_045990 [Zingiber officinale]